MIDLSMVFEPFLFGPQVTDVYDCEKCGVSAIPLTAIGQPVYPCGGRHQQGLWFDVNEFCAFRGNAHLGWAFPLPAPTYYRAGRLHFFAFSPYFAATFPGMVVGILMLLSGPVLASIVEKIRVWRQLPHGASGQQPKPQFFSSWAHSVGPYMLGLPFATTYEEKVKDKQYRSE